MHHLPITGYANRLSVGGGETISFYVSTVSEQFEARLIRPGRKPQFNSPISSEIDGSYAGKLQAIQMGSYGLVEQGVELPSDTELSLDILSTWPDAGRVEGVLTWGEQVGLFLDGKGRVMFRYGDANVVLPHVLDRNYWYNVRVTLLPDLGRISVSLDAFRSMQPRIEAVLDVPLSLSPDPSWFRLSGWRTEAGTVGCFNGKISQPRIFSPSRGTIADWDCSTGFATDQLMDRGPFGCHMTLFNHPRRAVTGPRWTGRVMDYRLSPSEYDALAFHQDDMTDAGWEKSLDWTVPEDLPSDIYALEITCAEGTDHIPFFVLPDVGTGQKIAFLAPTFSYMAYANERHWWTAPDIEERTGASLEDIVSPGEKWVNEIGMLSCYDRHVDGTGCCNSSWLRPIINMRADYVHPYLPGPHQLSADMYIMDWMRATGRDFDVVTDHDLHSRGASMLAPYNVVISGSHPEYVSEQILDAISAYVNYGGNFMYVGGNGLHSAATVFPDAPHVFELRRGHVGGLHWKSGAGEDFHAATGEPGGLWKLRNRAAQRTVGVGTAGVTFDEGKPYKRLPVSFEPEYEWIFAGVPEDTIGAKSDVMGGAAGFEYDRMDRALGSPRDTVLLASAYFDEQITEYTLGDSRWTGFEAENRSDIIIIEEPLKGRIFAAGSVSWTAALFDDGGDNAVARITGNVLDAFSD